MCAHVCRPDDNLECPPPPRHCPLFFFLRWDLSLVWSWPSRVTWLSRTSEIACICLPGAVTGTPLHPALFVGSENRTHVLRVLRTEQSPRPLNECFSVKFTFSEIRPSSKAKGTKDNGETKETRNLPLIKYSSPFGSHVPTKQCLQSKAHERPSSLCVSKT